MIWRQDSLLTWLVTQHARKCRHMLALQTDPRWSQIRFVRLTSAREVAAFTSALERAMAVPDAPLLRAPAD